MSRHVYVCNECGNPLYSKCGKTWIKRQEKLIPYLYSSNIPYRDRLLKEAEQLHEAYKGRYGFRGQNLFCNSICALKWATKRARPLGRGGTARTPYSEALEAIEMFLEYRDKHGYDETRAKAAAAIEVSEQWTTPV